MAASHQVQSIRARVEHVIGLVKDWKVLSGNKVENITDREQELDCVIFLYNLHERHRQDSQFEIPARSRALPDEHVFKPVVPENEVDLKIPPEIRSGKKGGVVHIDNFERFVASAAPKIKKALEIGGNDQRFFPTVDKRGENLYEGAYVLQLQVKDEGLDQWTVKYVVGTSYSYDVHYGYLLMYLNDVLVDSICDCYAG